MKNDYKVLGDTTIIYLKRRDGSVLETLISTSDLLKVNKFLYTWCATWNKGTESFYVVGTDYSNKKKRVYLHRLILDANPNQIPDHRNHDTLDNTRENLRLTSLSENQQNRKGATKKNASGVRGVYWHKASNKWLARVKLKGKIIEVGTFLDLKEAEKAVIEARKKHLPYSTN